MRRKQMIKAVIFDMDGVIIDSEPVYLKRIMTYLESENHLFVDRELMKIVGTSDADSMKLLGRIIGDEFEEDTFKIKYEEKFREDVIDYKKIVFPEIPLLLRDLRAKGYKLALASSSSPDNINHVLESSNLKEYFSVILSGHQFNESKPHPEIYLKAAELLKVKPEECMVLEDSYYGIESAKAAGMDTVVARQDTRFNIDQEKADYIFSDLRNIKWILHEDRKGEDRPVREIRVKSKEYIKSLFIRNNAHRHLKEESSFSADPKLEDQFHHVGYFTEENIMAVALLKRQGEVLVIEEFALSQRAFENEGEDLLDFIELEGKKDGIRVIQAKVWGSEETVFQKSGYRNLFFDEKYKKYEKTLI